MDASNPFLYLNVLNHFHFVSVLSQETYVLQFHVSRPKHSNEVSNSILARAIIIIGSINKFHTFSYQLCNQKHRRKFHLIHGLLKFNSRYSNNRHYFLDCKQPNCSCSAFLYSIAAPEMIMAV